MNKRGLSLPFEKIIALLIGLIVIIGLIFFSRDKLSDLVNYFLDFINGILK